MTDPEDALSEQWLEHLAAIDEQVLAGQPLSLEDTSPELAAAGKLLRDLRRIHEQERLTLANTSEGRPEKIGRFTIGKMIGAGGCAVVYQAWDQDFQRDVAIKVPLPHHLLNAESRERFVQEAQTAARLDHPSIVPAHEAGADGQLPYIAYAYCSGPTLAEWLRTTGPMQATDAAKMLVSLADAVHYSHCLKVLHRDLKPSNVLLFPTGEEDKGFPFQPKLTDFGFAKFLEDAASLTRSSVIVGTPIYATPEQLNAPKQQPSVATDIFGLGILLFESLTGTPPCQSESLIHALDRIRTGDYTKLNSRREVPSDLASICDKALAFEPADRYPSAEHFRGDLERFLRGEKVLASRANPLRRALRWAQAPQRIREAAGFIIISNAAMLLWILAWPVAIVLERPIASGFTNQELLPYTVPLVLLHVGFMILGVQTSKTKGWAAATGTLLSGALALFQLLILLGWISPPYPTLYPNVQTRDIVFSLLFCLFLMQFVLSGCAWLAVNHKRSSER